MAAALKAEGRTLLDLLDDLYREHGLHATSQLSVRVDDLTIIPEAMKKPQHHLRRRLSEALTSMRSTTWPTAIQGLPPTDGIRLGLGETGRVICRPSGTEPKLKNYVEVVVPVGDSMGVARSEADRLITGIKTDLSAALGLG